MVEAGNVCHDSSFIRFGSVHNVWSGGENNTENKRTYRWRVETRVKKGKNKLVYTDWFSVCFLGPISKSQPGLTALMWLGKRTVLNQPGIPIRTVWEPSELVITARPFFFWLYVSGHLLPLLCHDVTLWDSGKTSTGLRTHKFPNISGHFSTPPSVLLASCSVDVVLVCKDETHWRGHILPCSYILTIPLIETTKSDKTPKEKVKHSLYLIWYLLSFLYELQK